MNPRQLSRFSSKMLKTFQGLDKMAKKDPELRAITDLTNSLWQAAHALSEKRLLKIGERRDKGEVIWTVFTPVMLGKGPDSYCGGIRETVRTPHRQFSRWHWHSPLSDDKTPGEWRSANPKSFNLLWDFRNAMHYEERKAA